MEKHAFQGSSALGVSPSLKALQSTVVAVSPTLSSPTSGELELATTDSMSSGICCPARDPGLTYLCVC